MREILRQKNSDILDQVERLLKYLNVSPTIPELAAYQDRIGQMCRELRNEAIQNLRRLESSSDEILIDILSETQRLSRDLDLFNRRLMGPGLRGLESDRLSLRIIHWMHLSHKETTDAPAGVSTQEFAVWPSPYYPVVYFMPASVQRHLLSQALLFHEFGHLLYAYLKPKLDNLVRELQIKIYRLSASLSDHQGAPLVIDQQQRYAIALLWYEWTQELFCDAVGLTIGGPAFLNAFIRYFCIRDRTEYNCSHEQLGTRSHPLAWIRARLLAIRAGNMGLEAVADRTNNHFDKVAEALSAKWDFYGFYNDLFLPDIQKSVDEMLMESNVYHYSRHDVSEQEWTPDSNPVHLINQAWHHFQTEPETYGPWEERAINQFIRSPFG